MRRTAMNAVHYLARCTSTQAALALAALAIPSLACAGVLEGSVTFPGRTIPGSTIYARNLESGVLHQVALRRSERQFRLELPAGRYWLFMRPQEPGLAELYGAHTRASICRSQPNASENACSDHALHALEMPASGGIAGIAIDDWFLEDAQAEELDRILGDAREAASASIELGRPRFSEYRAASWKSADRVRIEVTDGRVTPFREQLDAVADAGANFAGRFSVARLDCGAGCRLFAIVDLSTGAVILPDPLSRPPAALPCRSDRELVFRDDSRLLEHTHRDGTAVITDYLLWDVAQRSFTQLAQYRRSVERFCGSTPQ
jgi:hypothetical protein